ncbi:MAG: PTS sugar transporter subunit IIA [Clostridium fessum]
MKITDLLDPRSISLDAAPTSKSETLDKAVELMAASGKLSDVEFRKQVYAKSTTGIGGDCNSSWKM